MSLDITVTLTGPLFSGSAFQSVMADIVEEARVEVGNAALERVQYFLNRQIRHPTPYYETQITQQSRGDTEIVHDRGIIYGPWLEGVSSRNSRTRFKGYASFRKATSDVEQLAPAIINRVIAKNMGRLQ